jgi:hypothetical protein
MLVAAMLLGASCGGGDSASTSDNDGRASETADVSTSTTLPAFEPSAEQVSFIAEITSAIEVLFAGPGVSVTFTAESADGGSTDGSVLIENSTGDHESRETLTSDINDRISVVAENLVVGDVIFARVYPESDDPSTVEWAEVESEPLRSRFIEEAFTAGGAAGASLERLVTLLENVPWELEGAARTDVEGRMIRSVLVRFSVVELWEFLREAQLELVGPSPAEDGTFYEFWIDVDSGALVRLLAAGTQFLDGEALRGSSIEIDYTILEEISIPRTPR